MLENLRTKKYVPEFLTPKLMGEYDISPKANLIFFGLSVRDLPTTNEEIRQFVSEENPKRKDFLRKASLYQREEYWSKPEYAGKDHMKIWGSGMEKFLDKYKDKPQEKAFLNRIGIDLDDPQKVKKLYKELFSKEGAGGDVEFFARKIADNNTPKEISQNIDIINRLGNMYGESFRTVIGDLTKGLKNMHINPKRFIEKYRAVPHETTKEYRLLRSSVRKYNERHGIQAITEKQATIYERLSPTLESAGGKSEKAGEDQWDNEDSFFVDKNSMSFGVFDGVGSSGFAKEGSRMSRDYIADVMLGIPANMPLEEVKKMMNKAFADISKILIDRNEALYNSVVRDFEKNIAGEMSDEAFQRKYPPEERLSWNDVTGINGRLQYIKRRSQNKNQLTEGDLKKTRKDTKASSTASVVKVLKGPNGEQKAILFNMGDSRVYRLRDGGLRAMTIDNNLLYDAVPHEEARDLQHRAANGEDISSLFEGRTMTLKMSDPLHKRIYDKRIVDRRVHDKNDVAKVEFPLDANGEVRVPYMAIYSSTLTKTLPFEIQRPNIDIIDIQPGDRLILTSDGIHDNLHLEEMQNILTANPDANKATEALVTQAKQADKKPDDTTAIVVNIQ